MNYIDKFKCKAKVRFECKCGGICIPFDCILCAYPDILPDEEIEKGTHVCLTSLDKVRQ